MYALSTKERCLILAADLVENKISASYAEFNPDGTIRNTDNIVKKFIPFDGTGTEV